MTPDEIKKGLEVCSNHSETVGACKQCPYINVDDGCYKVMRDAFDYIESLESDVKQLNQQLAQVEMEKKAAIHDCAMFPCRTCTDRENGDLCVTCCTKNSSYRSHYEWRGVCEENIKEE